MADLFVFTDARGLPRGPADVPTLRAWLAQGILAEDTRLTRSGQQESAGGGDVILARDVLNEASGSSAANQALAEPDTKPSGSTGAAVASSASPAGSVIYMSPDEISGSNLRPLTNSEMLDRTFQVYRHHFLQLFIMASLINLPPFLLHAIMRYAGMDKLWLPLLTLDGDVLAHLPDLRFVALALSCMLLGLALEWMAMSVLTAYVADLYLEKRVTLARAFWALRGKILKLLITHSLRTVIFILLACLPLASLLTIIVLYEYLSIWTGLALSATVLALFVPILLYTVHTLLVSQAIMLEGRYGFAALWRSSVITRYDPKMGSWYWGETRLSMLLLVFLATTILVIVVSGAPSVLTQERLGLGIADSSTISTLQQLLYFMGVNLVSPLYVLGATVFYFDIRVRREGYDMEVMARRLQAAETARRIAT